MGKITDKRRYVNTRLWTDTWVMDNLNPLDRLLFVYLLTNDRTNIAGVYEISLKKVSLETGIERDNLLKMIERMHPKVKYVDGYVILKNAQKHQNLDNPQIKKGIDTILEEVPNNVRESVVADESYMSPQESSHSDSDLDSDLDTTYMSVSPKEPAKTNTTSKEKDSLLQELHKTLGGTRPLRALTDYRRQLDKRLKEFRPDELRMAARGMFGHDKLCGRTADNSTNYATLEYLLRNDKNVEKYLDSQYHKSEANYDLKKMEANKQKMREVEYA